MRDKNVMFDEITSCPNLQHALTDLHVSEPGCNLNGRNIHFKVDTGACGNLLPVNLYKQIAGNKAKANFLQSTIDHSVNLMAYNNKQIKQLGTCVLRVSCGANTRMVKFFVVDSRLNPIIGLNDSHKLQLVNFNCPIHQSWTGHSTANVRSFDSISEKSPQGNISEKNAIPSTITKQWIVNNPKYKHLFKGIGKFNVPPVSITLHSGESKRTATIHGFSQLFIQISSFPFRFVCALQPLLKKDAEFIWTDTHTVAFNCLKEHVSNDVKLQFFDSSKPLFIEVDVSKRGIGAAMLQSDPIVQNTSTCEIPNNL